MEKKSPILYKNAKKSILVESIESQEAGPIGVLLQAIATRLDICKKKNLFCVG